MGKLESRGHRDACMVALPRQTKPQMVTQNRIWFASRNQKSEAGIEAVNVLAWFRVAQPLANDLFHKNGIRPKTLEYTLLLAKLRFFHRELRLTRRLGLLELQVLGARFEE
jgi:hypothetical protein